MHRQGPAATRNFPRLFCHTARFATRARKRYILPPYFRNPIHGQRAAMLILPHTTDRVTSPSPRPPPPSTRLAPPGIHIPSLREGRLGQGQSRRARSNYVLLLRTPCVETTAKGQRWPGVRTCSVRGEMGQRTTQRVGVSVESLSLSPHARSSGRSLLTLGGVLTLCRGDDDRAFTSGPACNTRGVRVLVL